MMTRRAPDSRLRVEGDVVEAAFGLVVDADGALEVALEGEAAELREAQRRGRRRAERR